MQMATSQALILLEDKWIRPIVASIDSLPNLMLSAFKVRLNHLSQKYRLTFSVVGEKIDSTEKKLSSFLKDLSADSFTSTGLEALSALLGGENE